MYLRIPPSYPPRGDSIKFMQQPTKGHFDGVLLDESVEAKTTGQQLVRTSGWALDKNKVRPAQVILIVDKESHTVLACTYTLVFRQDAADSLKNTSVVRSGWDVFFPIDQLGSGTHTVIAYVYDHQTGEAFPVPGQGNVTVK